MKKDTTQPRRAPKHWAYRFWSQVDVGEIKECWPWRGSVNRSGGYGFFQSYRGGEKLSSHRIAYSLHHKDPSAGSYILHKCDNPVCCNPYHLREGSHAENMADMARKGRASTTNNQTYYYGERHHNSKLSDAEVLQIREMINKGWKNKDVAALFGVKPNTVSQIKTGVIRKKVGQM